MNRRTPDAASAESTEVRPTRIPVGHRDKLSVFGKDDAFEYRWVNDRIGAIQEYEDGGWELVPVADVKVGHARANRASEEGSYVSQVVNSFDGMKAFLMKIKKEWFIEDQARNQAYIDEKEGSLSQSGGDYGKVKITRGK